MKIMKISLIALFSASILAVSPALMADDPKNDGFNPDDIAKLKERCHQKPDDPACAVVEKMLEHVKKRCESQPENPLCAKFNGTDKPAEPAK